MNNLEKEFKEENSGELLAESKTNDDLYFKDCFTEVDGNINAEFNKITVKCIDSENQNFSMDCDGNLVVNTITVKQGSSGSLDFNSIYPVGSVYINVNDTNPGTLFGGTWKRIEDKFLLCSGTKYATNSTGGKDGHQHNFNHSHTVTIDHRHTLSDNGRACIHHDSGYFWFRELTNLDGTKWQDTAKASVSGSTSNTANASSTALTGYTDEVKMNVTTASPANVYTSTEPNIPPYFAVSVWYRVS